MRNLLRKAPPLRPFERRSRAPYLLVFSLGLLLTLIAAVAVYVSVRSEDHLRFSAQVEDAQLSIVNRIERYSNALVHARALFAARQGKVTRAEFREFMSAIQLSERYPGIQGLGFTQRVLAKDLKKHTQEIRASGFPDYHVWPETPREEYHTIVYLEPFDWRNQRAFGYDMHTQPDRRAAMDAARDSGKLAMTGKVTLVQETETETQPGFLIYLPVYDQSLPSATPEERRKALLGFVYAPFRARDFFRGIFPEPRDPDRLVALEVFDGAEPIAEKLLYASPALSENAKYSVSRPMTLQNRQWLMRVASRPVFERGSAGYVVWIIVLGGVAINLLILLILRTARRRSEAESRHLREMDRIRRQVELILESAGEGIFGLDHDGVTTFINQAGARMLGYPAEEIIGKVQHSLIHHSASDGSPYDVKTCPIYAAFRDGVVHKRDTEFFWKKDGTPFPVEYTSNPILEGTKPVGAVVVFRDITERKRAEEELRDAVRTRDEFLSIASHELKTPLTPLKLQLQGLIRQLRSGNLSEVPPALLLRIASTSEQQVTRISRLIENLLDVSRINAGKLQLNLEKVDLCAVISELIERFRPEIEAAGCTVSLETCTIDPCEIDRTRIEQVITNLITNAIKYAPGTPIRIYTRQDEKKVTVVVEDKGMGIAPEDQKKIFSRFERVSTDQGVTGLGLGLYITRQIINAHGGKIWVESEPPKGSKFIFELPRCTT